MKWHWYINQKITCRNNAYYWYPLCWNEDVLEFDTRESAERFLASAEKFRKDIWEEVEISQGTYINDYSFLNATNLIIKDNKLMEVE